MFGPDVVVVQTPGLLLGADDDVPRVLGEAFKHAYKHPTLVQCSRYRWAEAFRSHESQQSAER
jgi:hypothetical protein